MYKDSIHHDESKPQRSYQDSSSNESPSPAINENEEEEDGADGAGKKKMQQQQQQPPRINKTAGMRPPKPLCRSAKPSTSAI